MKFYTMWFMTLILSAAFMTGCGSDSADEIIAVVSAPTVSSTIPVDLAVGVPRNTSITATFSEAMDPATISTTTFTLKNGATVIAGTVTYSGFVAVFKPTDRLADTATYIATITTGAKSLAGKPLAVDKKWLFITGSVDDTTNPVVSFTDPGDAATEVALNRSITATFDKAMNPETITAVTFTLKQGTTPIEGTVSYLGTVATFNPASDLTANTGYTATISNTVEDLSGNTLLADKTWSFTTGTGLAQGPLPVNLGTAGNFAILSKSGVDTTGATSITGDIGVSPAAATYLTGFSLSEDASTQFSTSVFLTAGSKAYAANYGVPTPAYMTTAVYNMEAAYVDAAGRSLPTATELGAGNISGLTIVPGLYKWGTGLLIATDVTLSGGANDVWIFQVAGDTTISSGAKILLSGGAQAKNIFWQSFGAVALGTTAHLEGNVISYTEITLATGATVNGRLLSQTAVTLQGNTVVKP